MIIDLDAWSARQLDGIRKIIREELAARDGDRILDDGALAELLGISRRALQMRLSRGSELAALATRIDGRRVWRSSDVDALLARGGGGKRGGASGGR